MIDEGKEREFMTQDENGFGRARAGNKERGEGERERKRERGRESRPGALRITQG
jgi:hypothetical protein